MGAHCKMCIRDRVPVVSFNTVGLEKNPGFKITPQMGMRLAVGVVYGDLIMRVLYATRPYEKVPGTCQAILDKWHDKIVRNVIHFNKRDYYANLKGITEDFDRVEPVSYTHLSLCIW